MAKDSSVGGNHNRGNCGSAVNKNRRTNYDQDNKNRIPNRVRKPSLHFFLNISSIICNSKKYFFILLYIDCYSSLTTDHD